MCVFRSEALGAAGSRHSRDDEPSISDSSSSVFRTLHDFTNSIPQHPSVTASDNNNSSVKSLRKDSISWSVLSPAKPKTCAFTPGKRDKNLHTSKQSTDKSMMKSAGRMFSNSRKRLKHVLSQHKSTAKTSSSKLTDFLTSLM